MRGVACRVGEVVDGTAALSIMGVEWARPSPQRSDGSGSRLAGRTLHSMRQSRDRPMRVTILRAKKKEGLRAHHQSRAMLRWLRRRPSMGEGDGRLQTKQAEAAS